MGSTATSCFNAGELQSSESQFFRSPFVLEAENPEA